jgi:eukaryotic-like serine/threonine-protein kinase
MENSSSCENCGRLLESGAIEGLCELCLMEFGLRGFQESEGAKLRGQELACPGAWCVGSDYELLSEISRGGMGIVYRARQISLNREVALKMILVGQWASAAEVQRFQLEAQASARLDHPSIVPVFELGVHEGWHFFTMKLIDGEDLARQVHAGLWPSETRAGQERIARLIELAAGAVHFAHQRGILHRDLKPTNILIDRSGSPYISDFGLAKLLESAAQITHSSAVLGTPAYMAPEQAAGRTEDVTVASDVYSLGAILYELLAGRPPHQARTPLETIRKVVESEVVPARRLKPAIDPDLGTICSKCLRREPAARYSSADELAADLGRWLRGQPVTAREATLLTRFIYLARRNPITTTLSSLLLLMLIVTSVVSSAMAVRITEARNAARLQAEENRRRVVSLLVDNGARAAEGGDLSMSLPWLVAAWRADSENTEGEWRHRGRINSVLEALPKLGALWFHERLIQHAAFSEDGQLAATASYDGAVRVWNTVTGEEVGIPRKHSYDGPGLTLLFHVAFSPDGSRVISAGNQDARIWDTASGALLTPPLAHSNEVRVACFSPDGSRVLTASIDRTVRCWDSASGQPVGAVMRHELGVLTAAWSSDGSRIASGGRDRLVRIWEAETGLLLAVTPEHEGQISHLEFSPDGVHLASACRSRQVRVWSAFDGTPAAVLSGESAVRQARFSPDGERLLTSGTDGQARIWNWRAGRLTNLLASRPGSVVWVGWSADGRLAMTATANRVRVWAAEQGQALTPPLPHTHTLCHAEIARDGTKVLAVGLDGTARLWSLGEPPTQPAVLPAGACNPNFRYTIARSSTGSFAVLDLSGSGKSFGPLPEEIGGAQNYAFSFQARYLAASRDGLASLYQLREETGGAADQSIPSVSLAARKLAVWKAPSSSGLSLSPDGSLVAAYGQNGVALFRALTGEPFGPAIPHHGCVRQATFSSDGARFLTVGEDGTGRIWETATGRAVAGPLEHQDLVIFGAFSPDGRLVVTASHDGTARVWNSATGEPFFEPLRHRGVVQAAEFSPNQGWLATVADGNSVRIWELRGGEGVTPSLSHPAAIHFMTFLEEDGPLLVVTEDLRAWLWEVPSGLPLTLAGLPFATSDEFAALGATGAKYWQRRLTMDSRPLSELERWSLLLTGQVVQGQAGVVSVNVSDLLGAWENRSSGQK